MSDAPGGRWLLALHSSSETLGVGLQQLAAEGTDPATDRPPPERLEAFPLGRALSNELFRCVEAVLPASEWQRLGRLAVATGPGGFTGTRLTVTLARTLAQQLALPLDGPGTFLLIARRLLRGREAPPREPFWLVQSLPRRGWVAGAYRGDPRSPFGVEELRAPRLQACEADLAARVGADPRFPAEPRLPEDAAELLAYGQAAARCGHPAPWQNVLPLYPTSPVEGLRC